MKTNPFAICAVIGTICFCAPNLDAADEPAVQAAPTPADGYQTVHNDFFWMDQTGGRIKTRSGCLEQFNGLYYWYGAVGRATDQNCYVSSDLFHWTNRGVVLHVDVEANRMDVLYNELTKQYVMFLKYDGNGAFLGIATSPTPDGKFTFKSQTLVDGAKIGDTSMYEDDDGKAYLCYVSWATGVNRQHGIYLMSPDYLTTEKRIFLWDIGGREAPHIFKRNGLYYYGTSKTAGIRSSGTSYYTATNLAGPWSPARPLSTPGSQNSWDTQVDFVYPIHGTQGTLYLYDGDRWIKNQGRQGDVAWLPMEFDGDTPVVNYYQDWDLNLKAGTWRPFDATRNLALGKTVTASSALDTNLANNVVSPTTYSNYTNYRWESAASDPQWIIVDLGAATNVSRVILKWHRNFAKEFSLQVSNDATTWLDVYTSALGASYSVTDVTFPTVSARYVRMLGTKRGTQNGYSLFSFAVLNSPP